MLILSGILVMVIGLMLRFNALLVVVAAGFVTGLAGGLSINDIVGAIGEAFVKNRYMSLFILICIDTRYTLYIHALRLAS